MAVIAILEMHIKSECLSEARDVCDRALKETRAFDGCLSVDSLVGKADVGHWIAYERWESMEHDAAYRKFRAGRVHSQNCVRCSRRS